MDNITDTSPTPDHDYSLPPDDIFWGTIDPNDLIKPTDGGPIKSNDQLVNKLRLLYVSAYSFALIGLLLNLAVIVALFKYKPKLARWTQILGLAITHLIRCLFLPLYLISAFNDFSWEFGSSMCKLGSYVTFVNMFSTTLIITFWNVRWCVPDEEEGPVKLCFCSIPKRWFPGHVSGSTVLVSWFLGAVLAVPSLLSMELQNNGARGTVCIENYDFIKQKSPSALAVKRMKAVMVSRFLFGLVFPIIVIVMSRFMKRRRQNVEPGRKSLVLWPVTISHLICWTPVLLLSVLQVTGMRGSGVFSYGLPVCTVLHVFNSCICPLICLWKGKREADREREREGRERGKLTERETQREGREREKLTQVQT